MEISKWFQNWCIQNYKKNSLGEKVNIDTIDNPGWHVRIDLNEIAFKIHTFDFRIDNGDDDWVFIDTKDGIFDGVGDKNKLVFILNYFREWCNNSYNELKGLNNCNYKNDLIYWLQNDWFCSLDFGGDYMYDYDINILFANNGWEIAIEVLDTFLDDKDFDSIKIRNSNLDWVDIEILNNVFKGYGDRTKLIYIIEKFKEWAKEYGADQHHPAYEGSGEHWPGGGFQDHTHIYNHHIPYKY